MGTETEKIRSNDIERQSENELIEQVRRGDQKAFARLVYLYEKSVYRLCGRFFMNKEDALDASQEVFVKIFKSIKGFEGRSSLKTWVYRVASNTCISIAERKKREKIGLLHIMARWWAGVYSETPEDKALENEKHELNQKIVSEKVASLPEVYRMPVILKDIEGFSLEKIAEILEIPLGTVKSRISRGRRLLQEALQRVAEGA